MTTGRLGAAPDASARLAARRPAARAPRRHAGPLLGAAAAVVVAGGALVGHGLAATGSDGAGLAVAEVPQGAADRLDPSDADRLVVDPASTRLLVRTDQGAHFAARTPSGELCLVRVPAADAPTEVCVPDRVGADATIGAEGDGQVRLVADGAPRPDTADGWRSAGPNVWVRD